MAGYMCPHCTESRTGKPGRTCCINAVPCLRVVRSLLFAPAWQASPLVSFLMRLKNVAPLGGAAPRKNSRLTCLQSMDWLCILLGFIVLAESSCKSAGIL